MANLPIVKFIFVSGPFWPKTPGARSGPEEVKFLSQERNQECFHLNPGLRKNGILIFPEKLI